MSHPSHSPCTSGWWLLAIAVVTAGCGHVRPRNAVPSPASPPGVQPGWWAPWPPPPAPTPWSPAPVPAPWSQAPAPAPWSQVPAPAPWQWPSAREVQAARAVAFVRAQLGKPYCWGGTGPGCFDCSGLTYAAWRWAGAPIPRTSELQQAELPNVALGLAQPGDVVWRPGHVGLYVGDGWVIHSPRTGDVVKAEPLGQYERALKPSGGATGPP